MSDSVNLTSPAGVTVTTNATTASVLKTMGYTSSAEKPKTTRKRASRKTAEPAKGNTPAKGSGPFG